MKTYWKWILGIMIVLAVLVAIPLGMHFLMNKGYISTTMYAFHQGPMGSAFDKPFGFDGGDGPGGFDKHRGWDHHGRGFGFFGPFIFFVGLLKLAAFVGLPYGSCWLGSRNARIALDPAPVAPAPAPKRSGKAAKKE